MPFRGSDRDVIDIVYSATMLDLLNMVQLVSTILSIVLCHRSVGCLALADKGLVLGIQLPYQRSVAAHRLPQSLPEGIETIEAPASQLICNTCWNGGANALTSSSQPDTEDILASPSDNPGSCRAFITM